MIKQSARTSRVISAMTRTIQNAEAFIATKRGQMLKKQRNQGFDIGKTEAQLDALEADVEAMRERLEAHQQVSRLQALITAAGATA